MKLSESAQEWLMVIREQLTILIEEGYLMPPEPL